MKTKISPAGFAMQLHKHLCQPNKESAIKPLVADLGSSKLKAKSWPQDSHQEGWLQEFQPPPVHHAATAKPTQLLARAAADLLHITVLHVRKKNQNLCQFSLIQQTVKLAGVSTAAPQAAEPSLEWGSGIPSSYLPMS